jgi:hypothetical protein
VLASRADRLEPSLSRIFGFAAAMRVQLRVVRGKDKTLIGSPDVVSFGARDDRDQ